jgi:PEGA domain-containing protein
LNERCIGHRSKILAGVVAGALALAYAPTAAAGKPLAEVAAATARPDLAAAKKHYSDGEKKFKAGDFAGALADFKVANDVKSTPQAERYIGLCEDSLGHPLEAASWYDKFLTHVPEKLASQGDEIRKRETELRALPGKVHVESNPAGATVTIDGKAQPAPTPTDVELAPGPHTVRFTEPGHLPSEKQIDVSFASTQSVAADLEPEPAAPAAPAAPPAVAEAPPAAVPSPPPPEPRSMVPAFVTGGLAVVAVGVGTVFGVLALNDKSDFDKNPTTKTADDGDTHALIADMAFGVALTFGVTSAVLFLTKDEQPASPPPTAKAAAAKGGITVTPTPWVGPRSGGAGFVLRF